MTIASTLALTNAVASHALTTGLFERVNQHEPKSSPGSGLSAAIWCQAIEPVRSSGLDSTSTRFEISIRVYTSMTMQPEDMIDPLVIGAVDVLMAEYSGDLSLGGLIRSVDCLGAYGIALSAQAGYIEQDHVMYRVVTITLPLIINDAYEQVD